MAALTKIHRAAGFGSVLRRSATLFIRPRLQKQVTLKHQLSGNEQFYSIQINVKSKMKACLLFYIGPSTRTTNLLF